MSRVEKPLAPSAPKKKKEVEVKQSTVKPAGVVSKAELVPVFVYGSLKKGFQLHKDYLEGQQFIGRALLPGFTMVSLGPYPALVRTGNPEHSVVGEYYLMSGDAYHAVRSMEERAGYETSDVEGKFSSNNAIPTLSDATFRAKAWEMPTDVGCAEWTLINHQGVNYGYVAHTSDKKE